MRFVGRVLCDPEIGGASLIVERLSLGDLTAGPMRALRIPESAIQNAVDRFGRSAVPCRHPRYFVDAGAFAC